MTIHPSNGVTHLSLGSFPPIGDFLQALTPLSLTPPRPSFSFLAPLWSHYWKSVCLLTPTHSSAYCLLILPWKLISWRLPLASLLLNLVLLLIPSLFNSTDHARPGFPTTHRRCPSTHCDAHLLSAGVPNTQTGSQLCTTFLLPQCDVVLMCINDPLNVSSVC